MQSSLKGVNIKALFDFSIIVNMYQLLHQYHKILAAGNIQKERACFIVWLRFFVNCRTTLHNATLLHHTATVILKYEGYNEYIFSCLGLHDNVQ